MYTASHEGTLPPTTSFLKVNIPGAVLSCFKIGKSGLACTDEISVSDGPVSIGGLVYNDDITVVRLYNCTSEATQGDITLYKTPAKTYQLNLNEEVIGDMECCGNRIPVKMKPGQIMTIGLV